MKKRILLLICICFNFILSNAQNPQTISLSSGLTPYGVDSYTRATQQINLLPGFLGGNITGGLNHFVNLSISSYPTLFGENNTVQNQSYVDPSLTPFTGFNKNAEFAVTKGDYAVNSLGNFVYTLPITTSPGTKGIEPNLSLSYNSQGYNGLLGVGWSLQGLSSISRSQHSIYDNGVRSPMLFTNSDNFALNGNRLIPVSGANGNDGTLYSLEEHDFSQIKSIGTQGNGPQGFEIKTNTGTKIEFGNGGNSTLYGIGDNTAFSWYVNKLTDEYGNFMTYNYDNSNGEIFITEIKYTGNINNNLAPYNSIKFEYITRADFNKTFVSGKAFRNSKLLKSITCLDINNQVIKKYVLEYRYDVYSLLYTLTETDKNGNQLNPTVFYWGEQNGYRPTNVANMNTTSTTIGPNFGYSIIQGVKAADINGDGLCDLVAFRPQQNGQGPANLIPFINNWGNASVNNNVYGQNIPFSNPHTGVIAYGGADRVLLGMNSFDEDDDSQEEVVSITTYGPYQYNSPTYVGYKYKYWVNKIKGTGVYPEFDGSQTDTIDNNVNLSFNNPYSVPNSFFYDVNNYSGGTTKDKLVSDQEKIVLHIPFGPSAGYSYPHSKLTVVKPGDFDGDGKLEVFLITKTSTVSTNYEVKVLSFNPATSVFDVKETKIISVSDIFGGTQTSGKHSNNIHNIDIGDVNGDGKTDLVYYSRGNFYNIKVMFSNGLLFEPVQNLGFKFPYSLDFEDLSLSLRDVNFDNKADIVVERLWLQNQTNFLWVDAPSSKSYTVLTSTGSNFLFDNYYTESYSSGAFRDFGDFNGDGNVDVFSGSASSEKIDLNLYGAKRNSFLKTIESPQRKIELEYCFVKSQVDFNSKHRIYEGSGYVPSIFVVNYLKDNNTEFRYCYKTGVFHNNLGFIGFQEHKIFNLNTLLGKKYGFSYSSNRSLIGTTTIQGKIAFTAGAGNTPVFTYQFNNLLSFEEYSNDGYSPLSGFPSNVYYKSGSSVNSHDYLNSVFYIETRVFDPLSSGKQITYTKDYRENSVVIKTFSESSGYLLLNGQHKIVQQISTVSTFGNNPTSAVNTMNYYYGQTDLDFTVKNAGLGTKALQTNYSNYNAFGFPTVITLSAGDLTALIQSTQLYDNTGRFIVKKINPLGNIEEYIYEPSFGNIIEEKDISGLITKYFFDGSGRLIKSANPNNTINKNSYEWNQNAPTFDGSYDITIENEGLPKTIRRFNKFGLATSTETEGFNNVNIVSAFSYDINNQLIQEEEPHFVNQTTFKVTNHIYEPDFFRKFKDIVYTNHQNNLTLNGTTEYAYNGLSNINLYVPGFVSVKYPTFNTIKKERTGEGVVYKIYDYPAFSTLPQISEYKLHASGQPSEIKNTFQDGAVNITTFVYDSRGNKVSMSDQSTGISIYDYNSLGLLIYEQTANGGFTYNYDKLQRLITKSGASATTYQYVTSGNGIQQIKQIVGANAITDFTYDQLGRRTELKETIGTKIFKTQFGYDKYGNETDYIYPNGFALKREYDGKGNLMRIKNGNTIIWECNTFSSPSKVNLYTYGNGIMTNIVYDNFNNLSEINHGGVHKQEYSIDHFTRNMTKRKFTNYYTSAVIEDNFTYDTEQRLKQVFDYTNNVFLNVKQDIHYFDNGNIKDKTDAGYYVYNDPNKPYSLTNINGPSNISLFTLNVAYTDFNKVSQINESVTNKQMDFTYGNNDERIKMEYSQNGSQYIRYYHYNHDRQETNTGYKEWNYIYAPTGLCAIQYNNNGTPQLLYALTDHLGSPVLLTDDSPIPNIVEEYNFDAWGRRRNVADGSYNSISPPLVMIRGYTMHEHLDEFSIINMNGRLYDPVIGRFIQSDNEVQAPDALQSFNRYAYVFNNPLKYSDPSGNVVAIEAAVAFVVGGGYNVFKNWDQIMSSRYSFGAAAAYFVAGGVSTVLYLYCPPVGLAVGGGANILIDATINHDFDNKKGGELFETVLQSGIEGALTTKEGAGYAADSYDALYDKAGPKTRSAFGMEHSEESSFSEFLENDHKPFRTALFSGVENTLGAYSENKFNFYEGSKNTALIDIPVYFSTAFLGSRDLFFYGERNLINKGSRKLTKDFNEHYWQIFSSSALYNLTNQNTGVDPDDYGYITKLLKLIH